MHRLTFPQDFLWGAATSAHQIEGNNKNSDWWQWEHSEARAKELKKQNKNPEEYYSGIACDSYHRYEEDFDIAQKLNQNAHRLSIEWARIEPRQGEFDAAEIEHYRKVLQALKKRGLKAFVTLHHFTNPAWFAEMGGWEKKENLRYFLNYVQKAVTEFKDLIDFLIVINEPNYTAMKAYLMATYPPQKRSFFLHQRVRKNIIAAHIEAYGIIKQINPQIQVGNAYALSIFKLAGIGAVINKLIERLSYARDLRCSNKYYDFIGIHYYAMKVYKINLRAPLLISEKKLGLPESDLGWPIYPNGLF
jgi:beta-glucosidase